MPLSKRFNGTWIQQSLYKLQRPENNEPFVYQKTVYTAKCTIVCNIPPSIKSQSFSQSLMAFHCYIVEVLVTSCK